MAKEISISTETIEKLSKMMKEYDLGEINLKQENTRLVLRRGVQIQQAVQMPQMPIPMAMAPSSPNLAAAPAEATKADIAVQIEKGPGSVTSPMVGTAYLSPSPGSPNFIKKGDTVKKGQTLLIVEAMKVMNPITASIAGTVEQIMVEDAQPVEFGEILVQIRP